MMKSETSVFSVFFFKERVFSGSFKGGKNTDVLKIALKHGDISTRNNKEFSGLKNHSNLVNLTHLAGLKAY